MIPTRHKKFIRIGLIVMTGLFSRQACVAADAPADNDNGWQLVSVPGTNRAGSTGWYRAWVKVPESFFTQHERNLFEESVGVYIRNLPGAHEAWMNGRRLGTGGSFPPGYQNGQEQLHRHKVPPGTLRKGQWNEIAIRVYQPPDSGPGGFLGPAPFIMDYFLECAFEGPWQFHPGGEYTPGSARTNKPAAAAFDTFRESSRVLGPAAQVPGPHLPPAESAAKLRPGPEFVAELILHEPLIAQPTHFSFDERGRLWVAQYRQYPYPAGVTMVSRDKYYRAHYDKVPPAPPHHDRGADIISIHEDTNGDGLFERHKVFLDGLNMANAVVRGHGGVWVMHTPYLLFYPDRNGDDVVEGPPQVRLAGFGLEDTHSVANGLVWGPDGWLYGGQGSTTSCHITRPGLDSTNTPPVYFEGCMVWRYHPETRAFEIFSEGGGNTFGLEFDAQGRLFSGHNGGGTRGWHFVQGGFYLMQGVEPGKFGPPRNPYAFGELPMMATTNHAVRFTHFGAFAEGTAMPSQFRGLLFALDPLHNVVLTSERRSRGATFETVDREPALRSDDATFRPIYIANAPDGSLFLSDMCEFYIAHGQHYQNQIDPATGRIYRLRGKDAPLERDTNLERKTTPELIQLLSHPNKWHRQTAVRLLGERKDPQALPLLREVIGKSQNVGALNALWALYQITRFTGEGDAIEKSLRHAYPAVRMWAVRLLGDEFGSHRGLGIGNYRQASNAVLTPPLFKSLVTLARQETEPEVLSQLASTARRLNTSQALELAGAVMTHQDSTTDPFIPQLCWWVFEAHLRPGETNRNQVRLFFNDPKVWNLPIVADYILPRLARRYAVEGGTTDLLACAELFRRAPSARHITQLMKGLEEAFRGRPVPGLPEELITAITKSGQAPVMFRLKQGDAAALAEALKRLQDRNTKMDERLSLARVFGDVRYPPAVPALLEIALGEGAKEIRKAALNSLSSYDDAGIGTNISAQLPKLMGDLQSAAVALLASRPAWSLELLRAFENRRITRPAIPEDAANRLRASKDRRVAELAARLLNQPPAIPGNISRRIEEIQDVLRRGPGNPYAGESAFMNRCAGCHKLFFKGGGAGPDLTAYQRDNLGTLLFSILNPNAEIREGFQYNTIETRDGRTLSGFFVERDNQVMVLRGIAGENIVLRTAEILELQPMAGSLMPEGLLDGMTEQELRDFFAYLRISQPITH